MADNGRLKLQVFKEGTYIPIEGAKITVTPVSEDGTKVLPQTVTTNTEGITDLLELPAPPLENSQKPSDKRPYSLCDIEVQREDLQPIYINGCQIYPNVTAIQQFNAKPRGQLRQAGGEVIQVGPNTLYGNYPPKIPEDPNKPLPPPPSGFVVLPEPVIPEFVIVHIGTPDQAGPNYTVRFKDYIKNVASSEIYSTWPENTIIANVLCILSFTLNRIYTEWYRGKGKDFDMTNSTAFDHYFVYGRNIYENISAIVDNIFTNYIKRIGRKQPLLTQYCDGVQVQCPGWLTQWGSKYLGDQGRNANEILRNFYGTDITLDTAKQVKGIPRSYPGYPLSVGSTGEPVRTIQVYLNRISQNYPAIPKQAVDGVFGAKTRDSVIEFQKIFNLPPTGVVNSATWYQISNVYVGVTRIAELRDEELVARTFVPPVNKYSTSEGMPKVDYFEDFNEY